MSHQRREVSCTAANAPAVGHPERIANRPESEAKRYSIGGEPSKSTARAQELRVAALLLREEAVGREERETPEEKVAENLSLQAQG